MTAAELIEELKKLPAETTVLVRGYEGGYCDAAMSSITRIELDVNTAWFYGPHDDPRKPPKNQVVDAVIL